MFNQHNFGASPPPRPPELDNVPAGHTHVPHVLLLHAHQGLHVVEPVVFENLNPNGLEFGRAPLIGEKMENRKHFWGSTSQYSHLGPKRTCPCFLWALPWCGFKGNHKLKTILPPAPPPPPAPISQILARTGKPISRLRILRHSNLPQEGRDGALLHHPTPCRRASDGWTHGAIRKTPGLLFWGDP